MPTLPTNPHYIGDSGHVNDHNTIVTALQYANTYQAGNKNRIINGNFMVNQRAYTSGSNLASGAYGFDRWKSGYTNTTLTFTAAPQGQTVTISTSGVVQQIIERANIPAGSYTLSWTGTATGRVYNSGASAPSYAASPITVALDGSANVVVEFTASGATKTLGNVQLEAGTSATPFEFETLGNSLQKCQRYYWRVMDGFGGIGGGWMESASLVVAGVPLKVPMRTAPTLKSSSGTDYFIFYRTGGFDTFNSVTITGNPSTNYAGIYNGTEVSGTSGSAGNVMGNNAAAFVAFDAEF